MTANESVELLFKCRMEGQTDVERLASAVKNVGTAATASAEQFAALERGIFNLTLAVNTNTMALHAMGEAGGTAVRKVSDGLTGAGGAARILSNELRVAEGAVPIRAVAQFLGQFQAISVVAKSIFPLIGAAAFVELLDQMLGKWGLIHKAIDPVAESQKDSLRILKESSKEYDAQLEKLKKIRYEEIERQAFLDAKGTVEQREQQAAATRQRAEQFDVYFEAGGPDRQRISQLENQLRVLRDLTTRRQYSTQSDLDIGQGYGPMLGASITNRPITDDEAFLSGIPGLESGGTTLTKQQMEAARIMISTLENPAGPLAAARATQETHLREARLAGGKNDEVLARRQEAEQKRRADEAEQRRRGLEALNASSDESLSRAYGGDKSPQQKRDEALLRINTERQKTLLETTHDENGNLVPKWSDADKKQVNADYDKQVAATWLTFLKESGEALRRFNSTLDEAGEHTKEADRLHLVGGQSREELQEAEKSATEFLRSLGQPNYAPPPEGYVAPEEQLRLDRDRFAQMQRSLQTAGRDRRTSGLTPGQVAAGTLDIQNQAAQKEYEDQMRINEAHLKDHELVMANLQAEDEMKKRMADNEAAYEDAIENIREKDLQKYQELSGSLFDAIKGHSLNQFGRTFLTGQEKTVFENATTGILQNAGHVLGGVTGGFNPLGLLTGTVLDPANAATAPASQTAKNTAGIWQEVKNLEGIVSKVWTGNADPSAALAGGSPAAGSSGMPGLFNLPLNVGTMSGINGGLQQLLGLTSSSNTSTFSQIMSGFSGGPSNAIGMLAGLTSPAGTVGYNSAGQPDDQWGNVITTSTATQFGMGMSIAATAAVGALAAVNAFSKGGAQGAMMGTSDVLGMAAMVPGPQQPFVAAAAAVTGLIGGLLSNGPQQRQQQITDYLAKNAYLAPAALNVSQSPNGTYQSFDARGNLMTSTMSAVPTVTEPYITKRTINGQQNWYDAPGETTAPYSGGAKGTGIAPTSNAGITINVRGDLHAMDSESFHQFVTKPSSAASVGAAMTQHLQSNGGERLAAQIAWHVNG